MIGDNIGVKVGRGRGGEGFDCVERKRGTRNKKEKKKKKKKKKKKENCSSMRMI